MERSCVTSRTLMCNRFAKLLQHLRVEGKLAGKVMGRVQEPRKIISLQRTRVSIAPAPIGVTLAVRRDLKAGRVCQQRVIERLLRDSPLCIVLVQLPPKGCLFGEKMGNSPVRGKPRVPAMALNGSTERGISPDQEGKWQAKCLAGKMKP